MSIGKNILSKFRRPLCLLILILCTISTYGQPAPDPLEPNISIPDEKNHKAAFIFCSDTIDEGLYESIKRRTKEALDSGATYIIYEMDTFGGRVDSAISINN